MKRIRNAALLAAALAVTSFSQAEEPRTKGLAGQMHDALAYRAPVQVHRYTDVAEQDRTKSLDHADAGRLNERNRGEARRKSREQKLRDRDDA